VGGVRDDLHGFRREYPDVGLQIRELMSDAQLDELRAGTLDVGFVTGPVADQRLRHREIMVEPLIAAIPTGHPILGRAGASSIRRLADEDIIMFPRVIAPTLFDETLAFCQHAGFSLRIAQEVRQSQTIISLVSAGLGIAIVPSSMQHLRRKGVIYRSFRERSHRMHTFAVWSPDQRSPVLERFLRTASISH
jgi:DNA-binding transcriptional LysR family regulator